MEDNLSKMAKESSKQILAEDDLIVKIKSKMSIEEKFPISEEVAIDSLVEFLNYYEVEPSDSMSGSMKEVIRAIRKGSISILKDEKHGLSVTQLLSSGATCKWINPLGAAKAQFSEYKDGQIKVFERIYLLAGAVTGMGETTIKRLPPQDLRIIEAVAMLFLAI